jgi:hypothetical protein
MRTVYVKCDVEENAPIPCGAREVVVSFDSVARVKIAPAVNGNIWPSNERDWVMTDSYFVSDSRCSSYSGKVVEASLIRMQEDKGACVGICDLCGNSGRNLPNEQTRFWVPLESLVV